MIYFFSSNAEKLFNEVQYPKDEDIYPVAGGGEKILNKYRDNKNKRSLNLSKSI